MQRQGSIIQGAILTEWQIIYQIAYLVRQLEWSSGVPVFKAEDVIESPYEPYDLMQINHAPSLIVQPGSKTTDDANMLRAGVQNGNIELILVTAVPGDKVGTASLMGRNQAAGVLGKGILEIEEKLKTAILLLTQQNGVEFYAVSQNAPKPNPIGSNRGLLSRTFTYSLWFTETRTYSRPRHFRATESGGTVTLTWSLPPDRFDFNRVVMYRHTSEITSAGTGTSITLSGDEAVTVANAPGAGTWYYSIFGGYLEPGNTVEQFSLPFNYVVTI